MVGNFPAQRLDAALGVVGEVERETVTESQLRQSSMAVIEHDREQEGATGLLLMFECPPGLCSDPSRLGCVVVEEQHHVVHLTVDGVFQLRREPVSKAETVFIHPRCQPPGKRFDNLTNQRLVPMVVAEK